MNTTKSALFAQAMEEHKGIIYKVVNSYCHNLDERQDLAQEILTTMWLSFDKYNNEFKFSTWMYRIALNVAISYYRKDSKREDKANVCEASIVHIADEPAAGERSEEIKQLYQFIAQLDTVNKAIMLLYLESESYDSIAKSLGISTTNVATRISRIKEKLKNQFELQES
ncbi:ECF subfamily RNA polymerase sigma-24 subunit [Catenovulum agarivorans DS-2]|uniref:ECF subfamily RNA polymerase sigma-24 subunit n=1 Tax=Catenovulum agarivorans DS-2 TaxID=1328313 RepID=W7QT67_9ALTE|nr:RNA polymerase sigma factor [Catenovulum agarivorans]EWH08605.1 ECF subfamily RNA polymerase sigma-24 subunit [Catenovulum agarivorans DS-2]